MYFTRAEYLSIATVIGTIIGAGIFGLPYVAAQSGLSVTIAYILILGGVIALMHLIYGEIVLRTKEHHFLPGYAQKYLGSWGRSLVLSIFVPGAFGTLLAYSIATGQFMDILLQGVVPGHHAFIYGIVFALLGIIAVVRRISFIAELELGVVVLLFTTIIGISLSTLPFMDLSNLTAIHWSGAFLPYGVVLFTVAGFQAIPEVREIFESPHMDSRHSSYPKAILTGTLLPLVIFIFFTAAVLGVTGTHTSQEALSGLFASRVPNAIVRVAALFGVLAIASSFLIMADNLKKVFWYDLRFSPLLSWCLVLAGTVILYLVSAQQFIKVIGLVGAVTGGLSGVIMVIIHRRSKRLGDRAPEYNIYLPKVIQVLLICLYFLGGAYQIWASFHGF